MHVHVHVHYLKKIIPILEMVAGEAHERSCDSKRKLTLGPNWILSPDGMVSNLRTNHVMTMCCVMRKLVTY